MLLPISNDAMFRMTGGTPHSYTTQKCYASLRQRETPCEECHYLHKTGFGQVNEIYMAESNRTLRVVVSETEWMGNKAFIQYATDISEEIKNRRQIEFDKEVFRLVAQQSQRSLLLYDVKADLGYPSDYNGYLFEGEAKIPNYLDYANGCFVMPESVNEHNAFFEAMRAGEMQRECHLHEIGRAHV